MPMLAAAFLAFLAASRLTDALERGRGDDGSSTQLRGVEPVKSTISLPVHRAQSSQLADSKVSLPVHPVRHYDSVSMPMKGLKKTATPTQLHADSAETKGETSKVVDDSANKAGHLVEDVGAVCAENGYEKSASPCKCTSFSSSWSKCARTVPKCIFIDLGAADGNSFQQFLNNKYGPVANCPSGGQWEALLVEANPQFTPALTSVANHYPGSVHAYASTAAYMCQGSTSFSIDPDASHNHWGSSMKKSFGSETVTVPTINVMQLVQEHVSPGDFVILKVDIEGAEYDLIPCLAGFRHANVIDIIYVEEHHWLQVDSTYTQAQYNAAKAQLRAVGVSIPDGYHTPSA